MHILGFHKNMRPQDTLGSCSLYAILDKGLGFKGKAVDSKVNEKDLMCGKQILTEPFRNNGTQKRV